MLAACINQLDKIILPVLLNGHSNAYACSRGSAVVALHHWLIAFNSCGGAMRPVMQDLPSKPGKASHV